MKHYFSVLGYGFEVTGPVLVGLHCFAGASPNEGEYQPIFARITVSNDPPPALESSRRRRLAHGAGWVFSYVPEKRQGYAWFDPSRPVDAWQAAAPLRLIIAWALEEIGVVLVHAAGIGSPSSGVLISGPSGSGKSSLASTGVELADLGYYGDDWVAVVRMGKHTLMGSVYRSMKLEPGPWVRSLREVFGINRFNEAGVARHPTKIIEVLPVHTTPSKIGALILPTIRKSPAVSMRWVSRVEAIKRIAPSTALQSPQCTRTLELLSEVLTDVPVYAMSVGSDRRMTKRMLELLCPG